MNSLLHELHLIEYNEMIEVIDCLLQKMTFTFKEQILLLNFKGELSGSIAKNHELFLSNEIYESLTTLFQSYADEANLELKQKFIYLSFAISKF